MTSRVGIQKVRRETIYAPDAEKQHLWSWGPRKSKALSKDAWTERDIPFTPTQFVGRSKL